MSIHM